MFNITPVKRWSGGVCCAASFLVQVTSAGQLQVMDDAASVGEKGLRIIVGATCSVDNVALTGPVVSGDQLACDEISTSGDVRVTDAAAFTAGDRVRLGSGFSVAQGATFTAGVDPFVDSPYAFVQDSSPALETSYRGRFDLNVDGLNLSSGEDIDHFTALSEDGAVQFQLKLRHVGGKQLVLLARSGGTLDEYPPAISLAAGFNHILLRWQSGAANNGHFRVSVDGAAPRGPTNLANGDSRIDRVRWGLVNGPDVITTSGSIDQDDFTSFR